MSKFRNLFTLFIFASLLSACAGKGEVEAPQTNSNVSEMVDVDEDGTIFITTIEPKEVEIIKVTEKDKEVKLLVEKDTKAPAKKDVEKIEEGAFIVASVAKPESVPSKPLLKSAKETRLQDEPLSTQSRPRKNILSEKERKKLTSYSKEYDSVEDTITYTSAAETETLSEIKVQSYNSTPGSADKVDTIYFDNGSSVIKSDYSRNIKNIAKVAKEKGATVYVLGFASSRTRNTDYVTHKMANFNVSLARAEAVADALIKAGVKSDNVLIEALSDTRPAYLEVMPEGERLNRRVEVYLGY